MVDSCEYTGLCLWYIVYPKTVDKTKKEKRGGEWIECYGANFHAKIHLQKIFFLQSSADATQNNNLLQNRLFGNFQLKEEIQRESYLQVLVNFCICKLVKCHRGQLMGADSPKLGRSWELNSLQSYFLLRGGFRDQFNKTLHFHKL